MGKISPVSSKYIVHSTIVIEGVVDRPDVIGAIFGQTEGLLGADLELREMQRSGRIGRIEVNVDTRSGKTQGEIIIPSSLDKAETAIVGAALEIIQRIGPCNAKIRVTNIEDVRISKRKFVIERAKELLKQLQDTTMPDSQELADEVASSVRVMEIVEYGKDRLPAGPAVDDSDEVIVVEGRADVINLLKHGIKNSIAINGTSVPQTVIELSRKKELIAFVDGDRGGDLILKELLTVSDIDFVTKAPDGKEVEEITKKEIHMALRSRITAEQARMDLGVTQQSKPAHKFSDKKEVGEPDIEITVSKPSFSQQPQPQTAPRPSFSRQPSSMQGQQSQQPYRFVKRPMAATPRTNFSPEEKKSFKTMLEDLIGTRGAYVLDNSLNILGKVPLTELATTIKSLNTELYAIVLDGSIDRPLTKIAEEVKVKHVVGMDSKVKPGETSVNVVTINEL
ncbi:TPA: DNA primase [Candidatus Woesearchaeota archaeon]|nr:DNA primase [Candidatus Woesearchaeota archaeon]